MAHIWRLPPEVPPLSSEGLRHLDGARAMGANVFNKVPRIYTFFDWFVKEWTANQALIDRVAAHFDYAMCIVRFPEFCCRVIRGRKETEFNSRGSFLRMSGMNSRRYCLRAPALTHATWVISDWRELKQFLQRIGKLSLYTMTNFAKVTIPKS